MATDKDLKVEVYVNGDWESTIALSRESLDVAYTFMTLLQLKQVEGLDIDELIADINDEHERSGL